MGGQNKLLITTIPKDMSKWLQEIHDFLEPQSESRNFKDILYSLILAGYFEVQTVWGNHREAYLTISFKCMTERSLEVRLLRQPLLGPEIDYIVIFSPWMPW